MSRFSPIIVLSVLALAGCDTATEETSQRETETTSETAAPTPPPLPGKIVRTNAGTQLTDGTFSDPNGNTLAIDDLKGTPVLLNLWATWCAPCKKEMPLLDNLADELGDEVKVLTISQDREEDTQKVVDFFAEREFRNLEQWLDPKADLGVQFAEAGLLPTTILFDGEGRELFRVAGDYEWDSEDAIAAIKEAIAADQSAE